MKNQLLLRTVNQMVALIIGGALTAATASAASVACPASANKIALVVIDMQPYFLTRGGDDRTTPNVRKFNQVIAAQKSVIDGAKRANIPIIIEEYDFPEADATYKEIKEVLRGYKHTKFLKKTSDGMFDDYNDGKKELIEFLKKENIGTLVITGANGGACVEASIQGALDHNCSVVAYSNGIADFNYRDFIYPYKYPKGAIKIQCQDCSFREYSLFEDIEQVMMGDGSSSSARPSSRQSKPVH